MLPIEFEKNESFVGHNVYANINFSFDEDLLEKARREVLYLNLTVSTVTQLN